MIPIAWVTSLLLGVLAVIHVYWACGGRRALYAAVPELDGTPLFQPGRGVTLVVAFLLATAAFLMLDRAGVGPHLFPATMRRTGTWILAAVLIARSIGEFRYVGFFKRQRGTRFARLDTRFYSPLALALGIGAAVVAASRHS